MSQCKIDSNDFERALATLTNLTYLELTYIGCDTYTSIGDLSAFIPHITNLRHLRLHYYDEIRNNNNE